MNIQRLTLRHYGATEAEDRRITLSPMNILAAVAKIDDIQLNGRSLREISVLMVDQANIDLIVNHADLQLLEDAVGSFCLGE